MQYIRCISTETLAQAHADTHTHTYSHSHSHAHTLTHTLTHSLTHSLTPARTRTRTQGLREEGWTIDEITAKTHPDYFYAAADAADQTFDQDRRKGTDVENERLQRPNFGNRAVLK